MIAKIKKMKKKFHEHDPEMSCEGKSGGQEEPGCWTQPSPTWGPGELRTSSHISCYVRRLPAAVTEREDYWLWASCVVYAQTTWTKYQKKCCTFPLTRPFNVVSVHCGYRAGNRVPIPSRLLLLFPQTADHRGPQRSLLMRWGCMLRTHETHLTQAS